MAYENPYIELVDEHPRLLNTPDSICAQQGEWSDFFGNDHPIHLEIGTGLGNFFSQEAARLPEVNFVGMEIKYKRVFRAYEKCTKVGRDDVVMVKEYAQKVAEIFGENELDQVYIFFPDPWPKERHAKNRLIQPEFLTDLAKVMKAGAKLLFKTDHEPYFNEVVEKISTHSDFTILDEDRSYEADKKHSHYNSTEFEMIWRNEGKKVFYLEVEVKK